MSIRLIAAAFELSIRSVDKFVLIALADHAHEDGSGAYPCVERLAWKTGLSERSVQYALRQLEADGLIKPVGSVHGGLVSGGRGNTTEYKITFATSPKGAPRAPFKPGKKGAPQTPLKNQKGAHRAPLKKHKGCTPRQKKGARRAPESKLESADDCLPSGLTDGGVGAAPPEMQSGGGDRNNHPPSVLPSDRDSQDHSATPDDSAKSVSIFPPSAVNQPKSSREVKIKNKAQAILEKRGLEPEFVNSVLNLIRKRARTEPATANYYISSFDNDSLDDWKAWIKISIVHDIVETAAREGRNATDVLRERLPGLPGEFVFTLRRVPYDAAALRVGQ